ncbi:MAG: serine/threonine-protein kinase [Candidatus Eisenbacteria bacterium]
MAGSVAPAWERVKELFDEALAQPAPARAAFVARAAGADDALRAEVESLLAAWERAESSGALTGAMDAPAAEPEPEDGAARLGHTVGAYRLEELIGHGGMGVVYRAEHVDAQLGQRAAVKLLRRDWRREDVRRFRDEQRILARLEHPHIARLLDAGVTEDGTPYLAMEYVDGLPLLEHCRVHALGLRARLELFEHVCAAVQAAHRSLIVHRDLKPSNLFVDRGGDPRLLDFGIAKRLGDTGEPDGTLTRTGQHVLTPEYASPEQFRAEPASTLSDVYSLGVVLYELLTGERPHRLHGLTAAQAERVVCTEEPRRPSAWGGPFARELAGDLDLIVLTALAKSPARRYASAAELADDLRRWREGLPVRARPDTLAYRARKFAGRNRGVLAVAALLAVALGAGAFATARQARETQRRFEQVRALANTLLLDINSEIRDRPGMTPLRQRIVARATAHLAGLAEDARRDPALRGELAAAYEQLGELQGDPGYASLGDLPAATASYRKARELRRLALDDAARRGRVGARADAARAYALVTARYALTRSWGGGNDESVTLAGEALDTLVALRRLAPGDETLARAVARVRAEHGWYRIWAGDLEPGIAEVRQGMALLDSSRARYPGDVSLALTRAEQAIVLTDGLKFASRYREVVAALEPVLADLDTLAAREPLHVRLQRRRLGVLRQLGEAYETFDPRRAGEVYVKAIAIAEAQYAVDASNFSTRRNLGSAYSHLGGLFLDSNTPERAIAPLERAAAEQRWLFARDSANHSDGSNLSTSLMWESQVLSKLREHARSVALAREALAVREALLLHARGDAAAEGNLASAAGALGLAQAWRARDRATPAAEARVAWAGADSAFARALEVYDSLERRGELMDFFKQDREKSRTGAAWARAALGGARTR